MAYEELAKMSAWKLKKLVKQRIAGAGFKYLLDQSITHREYNVFEIQEYLLDGNQNTTIAKNKARSIYK